MGDRDLLREARAALRRIAWDEVGSCEVDLSPVDEILARIDAALVGPPTCPACEHRARTERPYGWGVVDREGEQNDALNGRPLYRGHRKAEVVARVLDREYPGRAPHRPVRLVAVEESRYTAEHLRAARERAEENLRELGWEAPDGE